VTSDAAAKTPSKRKTILRRYLPPAIGLVFVVVTFVFIIPSIADYRSVWAAIKTLSWEEVGLLIGLVALNIATNGPPLMSALPGLRYVPSLVVTLASTASTYVAPGGAAVGMGLTFGMLRAWHFNTSEVTLAVTLTGVWNQLFQFGAPALALGLLTLKGTRQHGLLLSVGLIGCGVFVIGAGAFAAALSSNRLARWVGEQAARVCSWALRRLRRNPVEWGGDNLVKFRGEAMALLGRRWWFLTIATILGQLTVFAVLVGTLRSLGVTENEVNLTEAFAAWSVSRVIGSLPFMPPGGIGVVELGLTGLLIGFGGPNAEVTAAVLLYRALTIIPTLILGSLAGLTWRHHARAAT
jgi:uncharacterized membrane protein YbhN (UPF0104 family)